MFGSEKNNANEIGKIWERLTKLERNHKGLGKRIETLEQKIKSPSESESEAHTAARSAIQHNSRVKHLKEEASAIVRELQSDHREVHEKKTTLDELMSKSEGLLTASESASNKVQQSLDLVSTKYEEFSNIMEGINELLSHKEALDIQINAIQEQSENASGNASKIQNLLKTSAGINSKIVDLRDEIFGYEVEDENDKDKVTKVEGLKDKLEDTYKALKTNLNELTEDQKTLRDRTSEQIDQIITDSSEKLDSFLDKSSATYDETHAEIRKLLPDALTAGLSAAYDEKIKEEVKYLKSHQSSFKKAIVSLVIISLIPFAVDLYLLLALKEDLLNVIADTPKILLSILPLYFPVLWIAYSSNKKQNLSKRLIEEYTHKGVLSKTFEGLSNQIEGLGDSDVSAELRVKLLFNLLSVNSENPGKLISDYNTTDHPLMDALDKSMKYSEAVDRLRKVPGFSKMATKLDNEGKQVLAAAEEKTRKVVNFDKNDTNEETAEKS